MNVCPTYHRLGTGFCRKEEIVESAPLKTHGPGSLNQGCLHWWDANKINVIHIHKRYSYAQPDQVSVGMTNPSSWTLNMQMYETMKVTHMALRGKLYRKLGNRKSFYMFETYFYTQFKWLMWTGYGKHPKEVIYRWRGKYDLRQINKTRRLSTMKDRRNCDR